MSKSMQRAAALIFVAAFMLACQSEKQKSFDELTQRAREAAGKLSSDGVPSGDLSNKLKNIRIDFDNWAKTYNTQPVEQQGKFLQMSGKRDSCEWFAQLESGGKTGACFAKQERMIFVEGSAKMACIYDCFYP